jgi:hypothetical protein
MNRIDLQSKTQAETGEFSCYWFENEEVGLARTKFCRFEIPLAPFDSGLDYEQQPVKTDLLIEWLPLDAASTQELDGLIVSAETHPSVEGSIFLGAAHNWCDVKSLRLKRINDEEVEVIGEVFVELQHEGIAPNESFSFATRVFCDFEPTQEDEYWNMTLPDFL